jgi:isopenicillin N synthase-like dioxygenase
LDLETKQQYELPAIGRQRGYTSRGMERAKQRTVADVKEFWHVGPSGELATGVPENVWPSEAPNFEPAAKALWSSLDAVGQDLLRALADFLGADGQVLVDLADGGNTVLRMIRYPGQDEVDFEPGAVWAAEHEDINLITLLLGATDRGLEVLRRDGEWVAIEPIPGQLIADTGDMMRRITNGVVPATTHRVIAPGTAGGPRYSIPFFIHPRPDAVLSALPSCVNEDNPQRWPDVTAQEFLNERLRETGVLPGDNPERESA